MNCCEVYYKIKTASCEVIIEHLNRCTNFFNPPLHTYVDIQKYGEKIDNHAITFEAWDENTLVGLIAAYFNDENTKIGFITNVSMLKEYQGLGIASKLLLLTIEYGKEHNFRMLRLEVNKINQKALTLYKRHGFVETQQNENSVMMEYLL
jgi:ribosomal-protein-alanine N-acetyltransferase